MPAAPAPIHLRTTTPDDLPALFAMQQDPVSNQLAGTKPRDLQTFTALWEKILQDPGVTPRTIIADGSIVGSINCFKRDDADFIGYWIARDHWGRGIAGRAIAIMLQEFSPRPLFAQVAAHNPASLRALARNGFLITARTDSPETDRYTACETLTLRLG